MCFPATRPRGRWAGGLRLSDEIEMVSDMGLRQPPPQARKPSRSWHLQRVICVALVLLILATVSVVVVREELNKHLYPNYVGLSYTLADSYSGTTFFDNFDFFTGDDPSSGFVHYVDSDTAIKYNLTQATSSSASLRVDTSMTATTVPSNTSAGRFSVRISSKKQYATGLFIFDIVHTPTGCGTWPALWLADPAGWPQNGEIDVMEAANVLDSGQNQMTLRTSPGCSMGVQRKQIGSATGSSSCADTASGSAGCVVDAGQGTVGDHFNSNGGGIVAMELRAAGIRMWQFARGSAPTDLTSGSPDPSRWREATADFPCTKCDIASHFKNQSILASINLCGSWAGAPSSYNVGCPGTCEDFVAKNAAAFENAYWEFGNFSVYTTPQK